MHEPTQHPGAQTPPLDGPQANDDELDERLYGQQPSPADR